MILGKSELVQHTLSRLRTTTSDSSVSPATISLCFEHSLFSMHGDRALSLSCVGWFLLFGGTSNHPGWYFLFTNILHRYCSHLLVHSMCTGRQVCLKVKGLFWCIPLMAWRSSKLAYHHCGWHWTHQTLLYSPVFLSYQTIPMLQLHNFCFIPWHEYVQYLYWRSTHIYK